MCNPNFCLNRTDWRVPNPSYTYNSFKHLPWFYNGFRDTRPYFWQLWSTITASSRTSIPALSTRSPQTKVHIYNGAVMALRYKSLLRPTMVYIYCIIANKSPPSLPQRTMSRSPQTKVHIYHGAVMALRYKSLLRPTMVYIYCIIANKSPPSLPQRTMSRSPQTKVHIYHGAVMASEIHVPTSAN